VLVVSGLGLAALNRDALVAAAAADIRLPLWRETVRMIGRNPVFGVGPGNFRREFSAYRSADQMARGVAGAVTEHPHNELLHLAAELGLPFALAWLALLAPLAVGPGRGAFWRCAHFSACIILGHAMLDKTLVQPPTSLLGLIMLGLCLRRVWRARVFPAAWRTRRARLLAAGAVATACAALGLFAGLQHGLGTWYIRRGAILESRGRFRDAYDAYCVAAGVRPRDVHAHAYAGTVANSRLRDPQLALRHLNEAWQLEPNFGHINGQVASALLDLGNDAGAKTFFERECGLFPCDLAAHEQLLACRQRLGEQDTEELEGRIEQLRRRVTSEE